jgi:hypothetical protein
MTGATVAKMTVAYPFIREVLEEFAASAASVILTGHDSFVTFKEGLLHLISDGRRKLRSLHLPPFL